MIQHKYEKGHTFEKIIKIMYEKNIDKKEEFYFHNRFETMEIYVNIILNIKGNDNHKWITNNTPIQEEINDGICKNMDSSNANPNNVRKVKEKTHSISKNIFVKFPICHKALYFPNYWRQ